MLKHCGAAILTNYDSFFHQKCFSDSPKNRYCRSQNMNNQKHWYTPYFWLSTNISWHQCPQYIQDTSWFRLTLLQIDISSFRAFRQCNTSWWTQWHWHLHTHGTPAVLTWYTNWPHLFFGAAEYAQIYAGIIFSSPARIPPRHYVLWVCEHMICMYGTLGHEWVFYVQSFTYLRLSYRLCVLYRFTFHWRNVFSWLQMNRRYPPV